MSYWNHRVVEHIYEDKTSGIKETYYCIHEVYYNEYGDIEYYTIDDVAPFGETLEELSRDLELFRKAIEKPFLKIADLPGEYEPPCLQSSSARPKPRD